MAADQAQQILECYDDTASFRGGVSGTDANEVNQLLREIDPDGGGYSDMLVWTRGEERDCGGSSTDNSTLAENLRPDDQRFAPFVFSGSLHPSWNVCFLTVKDQIVLRFGGPPDGRVVIGIWRLSVPSDGRRPKLNELASQLNGRYPLLELDPAAVGSSGFSAAAFTNAQGERLNAEQIGGDLAALAPPTLPTPPATTEACGLFYADTCPRTPPQSERDNYAAQMGAYEAAMQDYRARRAAADTFGPCVRNSPHRPGGAPIDVTDQAPCGPSVVVVARPYPGEFAEAYFVGIYDHRAAAQARLRLDEFVRSRRGQRAPENGAARPPI